MKAKITTKITSTSKTGISIFIAIALFFSMISFTLAIPEGTTDLTIVNSSRKSPAASASVPSYAGNVTQLSLTGSTTTQTWQGFVGNVTGTITLDDSSNFTLFNWTLNEPEGEVYATYLSNISWTTGNIKCWNWSIGTGSYLQLSELEGYAAVNPVPGIPYGFTNLSLATDDVDGVNETFECGICDDRPPGAITGAETHAPFYVGGQLIDGNSRDSALTGACPVVRLLNSSGNGTYEEVLLYHDVPGTDNDGIIYTAILNISANGYDNRNWDFEMIVGENGHDGDSSTTPYYFYVELE